jgi:pimeloyl-ACP methyl ester carboxylesterase
MFDPQIPAIAGRYRLITIDVRGHGFSRPCGTFGVPEAAEDLVALLDQLGYRDAVFVGQSMGGNIAQELVFQHPDRVAALVIIGSSCNTWKLSLLEQVTLRITPFIFLLWPYDHLLRTSANLCGIQPATRDYLLETSRRLTKPEFLRIWRGLIRIVRHEPAYRIDHPLLLTHGELDRTGNVAKISPLWAKRESRCHYEVIPDAGHLANYDNPRFFNRLLLEFLAALPLAGR